MSREQKLALLIGFALVLVVGVVVSDHFSTAMHAELEPATEEEVRTQVIAALPESEEQRRLTPNLETQLASRAPIQTQPPGSEPPSFSAGAALSETLASARRTMENIGNGLRSAPVAAQSDPIPVIEMGRVELVEPPTYDGPIATHVVERGESLWGIAERRYGEGRLHEALAKFNDGVVGAGGIVRVGSKLKIPPKDVLLGKQSLARGNREAGTREESGADEAERTYTVQKGDTLGEIAQRELGSAKRWREIVRLNEVEDPDRVPVGTVLKLPR